MPAADSSRGRMGRAGNGASRPRWIVGIGWLNSEGDGAGRAGGLDDGPPARTLRGADVLKLDGGGRGRGPVGGGLGGGTSKRARPAREGEGSGEGTINAEEGTMLSCEGINRWG